ncbi:MAG: hypothetical protein A2Z04_04465 [Chloroflexi bacterium RBG_16_57_9]|nr:MAG: hypothetical protein A2Z04_04465 [Chloroflexi bacterium RBG_16_57_9]
MDAVDYLVTVRALLGANIHVVKWEVIREEAQGDVGLYRYRVTLQDSSLLEMFERFEVQENDFRVTKYSFQWQSSDGQLRKRWDNATHHPEISTHPHHVHDGPNDQVLPHEPVVADTVLALINGLLDQERDDSGSFASSPGNE